MCSLELSPLSNELIQSALSKTIENHLETTVYNAHIETGSKKGDNFVGEVYRILAKCSSNDQNDENPSKTQLIVKVTPQHRQVSTRCCFMREIYMFDKVLPSFREFEQSKGIIPDDNSFHEYPACYKFVDTEPFECLVMEDLCAGDFTMIDRRTEHLTVDHVNLVLRTLAKMHAISFAMKDQQPEKFEELVCDMNETLFRTDNAIFTSLLAAFGEKVLATADSLADKCIGDKIKALFNKNLIETSAELLGASRVGPNAVICHGDCWNNNTMFKLNVQRKPIEVRLLDFQIARYASPVFDILYYIFCCTDKQLRDQHYDSFLEVYHSSLSEHLERYVDLEIKWQN